MSDKTILGLAILVALLVVFLVSIVYFDEKHAREMKTIQECIKAGGCKINGKL